MNPRGWLRMLGATLFAAALAVFATWPQARTLDTTFISHQDPYFSTWRVAWIAHALTTAPARLFDTNVFYPTTNTLAFSDATLLQGLIGAPLFWLHFPPVLIYNLLLLLGFAGSGLAMFVLARELTGATGPALVAAAVFTLAPYRIEHVMHLELQWAMWIPLTFWALHRLIETGRWTFGLAAGLFVWLQIISCVYYGVFLAITLALFVPLALVTMPRRALPSLPGLAIAGVAAGVLTLPYLWPYMEAARSLGSRNMAEVANYSAHPINYVSATGFSWLWGWTEGWGGPELRLYPGIAALVLGAAAVLHRAKRWVLLYVAVAIVALIMTMGLNSAVYRWLIDHVSFLRGLRAPARFAIVGSAGLAVLAAFGAQVIGERARWRAAVIPLIMLALAVDYANRPLALTAVDLTTTAPIYRVIRSAGPGVIAEFPAARPDLLPGPDPFYSAWSITHWHPLLNGYSGYHPQDYLRTLARLRTFPDDASIARLRERDVRYVVVHEALFEPADYTALLLKIGARSELKSWGRYQDPLGNADLFVLER